MRPMALAPLCAALAVALAAPAPAQTARQVEGELVYRARIALPPQAVLTVEAVTPDGAVLARDVGATGGAQVPLPFALSLPGAGPAELRAAVYVGGRAAWVAEPLAIAPGDDPLALGEVELAPFEPLGFSSAWRCGERLVEVALDGGRAVIDAGDGRRALTLMPAASGARFSTADDPGLWFWNHGDVSLLSLDGVQAPECRPAPPPIRTPYVARGNEPGWTLRVEGGRMTLVSAYGAERTEAPLPPLRLDGAAFVFEAEAEGLRVEVDGALCRDDATGMPHPDTVRVETSSGRLQGCGGDPAALLAGPEWRVEDIGGGGVIDASHVTLAFDGEGGVAGDAGCNRYRAAFEIGGETVDVGPAAATLRACPEALMAQERRFLDALAEVARFDLSENGALLLLGPGGDAPLLTARRP